MIEIKYDVLLLKNKTFATAKTHEAAQTTRPWSKLEKDPNGPFILIENIAMHYADEDYQVEAMADVWIWASDIDLKLLQQED